MSFLATKNETGAIKKEGAYNTYHLYKNALERPLLKPHECTDTVM